MTRFADRADAGRRLAGALAGYRGRDAVVLGLPRGGVPVAYQVAAALSAPLDVLVVRKLGVPHRPELAFGAIGEGTDGDRCIRVFNDAVLRQMDVPGAELQAVEGAERTELERRVHRYRGRRPGPQLAGRVVLIVDDGFATGATARVAALVARARGAATVVLAAPIGAPAAVAGLGDSADDVVCLTAPGGFTAVGQGYQDFAQTSDAEVCSLLESAHRKPETGQ